MFNDGSPKESHRLVTVIAVAAGLLLFITSFGAQVQYRSQGRDIVLEDGAAIAQATALIVVALLIAWHRGYLDGAWPLITGLLAAVLIAAFLAGDWLTGWRAEGAAFEATARFYVTLTAALVLGVACAVGLRIPVVERSESHGRWESRRTRRP